MNVVSPKTESLLELLEAYRVTTSTLAAIYQKLVAAPNAIYTLNFLWFRNDTVQGVGAVKEKYEQFVGKRCKSFMRCDGTCRNPINGGISISSICATKGGADLIEDASEAVDVLEEEPANIRAQSLADVTRLGMAYGLISKGDQFPAKHKDHEDQFGPSFLVGPLICLSSSSELFKRRRRPMRAHNGFYHKTKSVPENGKNQLQI
ncbi:hypothetical protein BDP27DRAFT_1484746 [Rhodocollybia butyracea]|uniref:Uncharacterized protein n=1 Tax=Rhodocollybia butyracea TaxID=206335 RepID=A0A9P5U1S1_9AGAR|nr:hypothetical protein BDP27DRAFT_1484746 [Rhodocollybia butyracea]